MPFGVESKIVVLFLLCFCFFNSACAQSEKDKIKLHNEYANKASELRKQGNLDGAIQEQKKAVELFPDNADTLAVLAGMYMTLYEKDSSKDNLENAKQLLEKANKINPNDAVSHKMYSTTLELLGDKQGALREMEITVKLQPDNFDNLVNLGVIQKSLGDGKSARENFEKVLEKNPNYIYALYQYGEAELEDGNLEKAKSLFEKAVKQADKIEARDKDYMEQSKMELEKIKNKKAKAVRN
jgi:tetratricopeptide (TPR) repeat protein